MQIVLCNRGFLEVGEEGEILDGGVGKVLILSHHLQEEVVGEDHFLPYLYIFFHFALLAALLKQQQQKSNESVFSLSSPR